MLESMTTLWSVVNHSNGGRAKPPGKPSYTWRVCGKAGRRLPGRFITIVLDSGGVGALPDAATYGDAWVVAVVLNVVLSLAWLPTPGVRGLLLAGSAALGGEELLSERAGQP